MPSGPNTASLEYHRNDLIHRQDELTVEFGELSVLHIISKDPDAVIDTWRSVLSDFAAGVVSETVWMRNGKACRAKATIGVGHDAVTVKTVTSWYLGHTSQQTRQYEPYVPHS